MTLPVIEQRALTRFSIGNERAQSSPLVVINNRKAGFAILAMVLSALCWGSATVMGKVSLSHFPPFTLLAVQLSASVAFLWCAVAITGARVPFHKLARKAALGGLLEPGLAYSAGTSGLALTGAAHASLVGATEPLLIVLLAWMLLRDRPSRATFLGVGLVIVGLVFIAVPDLSSNTHANAFGDGLVLLGTVFAALYVILTSRFGATIAPLALSALQQSVGLILSFAMLTVVWLAGFEHANLAAIPARIWLFGAFSGIVQYALGFWLYLIGLRILPASVAGLFLALIPVFGVGGAIISLARNSALCKSWVAALSWRQSPVLSGRDRSPQRDHDEPDHAPKRHGRRCAYHARHRR